MWKGSVPYRDFLFSQTPGTLYLLAPLSILHDGGYFTARLLFAAMGAFAILLTMHAAWRCGGRGALACVVVLLATNAAFCFDVCTIKTAAPAALLLAASFDQASRHPAPNAWARAALLASLAVGVRLSALPVVVAIWIGGIIHARGSLRECVRVTAFSVVPAVAILAPFWIASGDRLLFDLVQYHNVLNGTTSAGPAAEVFWKFTLGVLSNQGVAIAIGAACALWLVWTRWRRSPAATSSRVAFIAFVAYGAATVLHATRTAPYPTHQTMLLPVLVLGGAITLSEMKLARGAHVALLLVLALATVPLQDWALRMGRSGSLAGLRRAGSLVRENAAGGTLLTFDPALAVSAGLTIPRGYEMGRFSYLPGFAAAKYFHAIDEHRLLADLCYMRPAVALLDMDLARISAGEGGTQILEELRRSYVVVATVPEYGQFDTDLYVLMPRGGSAPTPKCADAAAKASSM